MILERCDPLLLLKIEDVSGFNRMVQFLAYQIN